MRGTAVILGLALIGGGAVAVTELHVAGDPTTWFATSTSATPAPTPLFTAPLAPPVDSTVPSVATAPPAAATPPPAPTWSTADCDYAQTWLAHDRDLDLQAQEDGRSPTTDPNYYGRTAGLWLAAYQDAVAACSRPPVALAGAACTDPPTWFRSAAGSHRADAFIHPANAAWDAQWAGVYERLIAIWAAVGCP